jgi:hypothetical protein
MSAVGLPTRASGQAPSGSRWSVQPLAGILLDSYDLGFDDSRTGALVGLQIGRRLGESVRAVVSVAYARASAVGGRPPAGGPYAVMRNEWVFASAGPVFDLPVQRATVSLSFEAGAAWWRIPVTGLVGDPDPRVWPIDRPAEFAVTGVVIPGVAVRYALARRLAVVGGANAYFLSPDEGGEVSPAFTLGVFLTP